MSTKYVTFSIREETLDRLRRETPPGVSYSSYLEYLLNSNSDTPDTAWRKLAYDFVDRVQKLARK